MLVAESGGGTPIATTPPPPVHDSKVDEAVKSTMSVTEYGPEPEHAVAYQIGQTLARTDLTQAEKDEYVARMVELTQGNVCSVYDQPGRSAADVVRGAFEDIGTAWSGEETPALRDQVTAAIGRDTNAARLSADDIYGLVDPGKNAYSDGARNLLTGIANGPVLNNVAGRLLTAAKAEGYDINKYQNGPAILTAAADIANMAATYGAHGSADAIMREVGRQMAKGPVAGDMTLIQAMMATTTQASFGQVAAGRSGFDALAGLLNGAYSFTSDLQPTADMIFATLTRSGDDGYVGGMDQAGDRSQALGDLGQYFNTNLSRLNENGWKFDSAGSPYENLVQDFTANVLLDKDYPYKDWTTDAISSQLDSLAGTIQDTSLPIKDREAAATSLGELVGSLKGGANDFFEHGKADNDAKISAIRFFADQLTGKLSSAAGPFGKLVDMGVDAGWGAVSNKLDDGLHDEVRDALGDLETQSNAIRIAIGQMGDADIANDYDQRYVEHAPD